MFDPAPPFAVIVFAHQLGCGEAFDLRWRFVKTLCPAVECVCGSRSNIAPIVPFIRLNRYRKPQCPRGYEQIFIGQCQVCRRLYWHDQLDFCGRPLSAGERDFVERPLRRLFVDDADGGRA